MPVWFVLGFAICMIALIINIVVKIQESILLSQKFKNHYYDESHE